MARVLKGECKLLRAFCDSAARHGGQPLAEALLQKARAQGLAGATLFDGVEGFSSRAKGSLAKAPKSEWSFAKPKESLVEIVDEAERVDAFLQTSGELLKDATVTIERAFVVAPTEE